jgi:RND family efflux transporter MFP subunit
MKVGLFLAVQAAGLLAAAGACAEAPAVRGIVKALTEATIAVDYSARISAIPVAEGGSFRKGDVLVKFDCRRFKSEVAAARAGAKARELVYGANQRLLKRGAIGANEVAVSQAEFEKARAEFQAIAARTGACEYIAPFDGRMVARLAQEHETPAANQPLIRIVDTSVLELETIVPSKWVIWVKPGTGFQFKVDETGETLTAEVVRLGATVDPVSQTIKAIGILKDRPDSVLPGMSGTATFHPAGS